MKKVFKFERTDNVDCDEYDSCIIVADDIEDAKRCFIETYNPMSWSWGEYRRIQERDFLYNIYISEINLDNCETEVICASYNAG